MTRELTDVLDLEGKGSAHQIMLLRDRESIIVDASNITSALREEIVSFLLAKAEELVQQQSEAIRLAIRLTALAPMEDETVTT